jgi:hypothetical protein
LFFIGWFSLTMIGIDALWPRALQGLILVISVVGIVLAAASASRGNRLLGGLSLAVAGTAFFALLFLQIASRSVAQISPASVMQFVMILFAVEIFSAVAKLANQFSGALLWQEGLYSVPALQRSLEQAFRRLSRAAVVFGTGYVSSMGALFLGAIAPIPGLLGDISLYVVVVSIALALLLVLREDEATRERTRFRVP